MWSPVETLSRECLLLKMANAITRFHAKYYAALLSGQSANGDIGSLSQSLLSSTVDINPHQIDAALSLSLEDAEVVFDQKALSINADLPEYLQGQSGLLILSSLAVSALADEQYMLFNAITDEGRAVAQEDCEKLFLNGGTETPCEQVDEKARLRLRKDVLQHSAAKLKELDSRNLAFFKTEENRIYQWEYDVIDGIEAELSAIKKQILQTEREARYAESVAEKLMLEKKVEDLKRKKRRLRNELDDREEEVSKQRRSMIAELEQRMIKQTEQQHLFVIRWKVKEY